MQLDSPMHLYAKPSNKFVAGFIGSPAMNFIKGLFLENENTYFIEPAPGCVISLGAQIPVDLQSKIGQEIEIGIRPENIIILSENQLGTAKCEVEVMAFENMGNEQLIYLSFPGHNIIARNLSQKSIAIGDKFFIQLSASEIIYLESSTGMIIE